MRRYGVFFAPSGHAAQDWYEIVAFFGQAITVVRGAFDTVAELNHAIALQGIEPARQSAGIDAGNRALEITKALRSGCQVAK